MWEEWLLSKCDLIPNSDRLFLSDLSSIVTGHHLTSTGFDWSLGTRTSLVYCGWDSLCALVAIHRGKSTTVLQRDCYFGEVVVVVVVPACFYTPELEGRAVRVRKQVVRSRRRTKGRRWRRRRSSHLAQLVTFFLCSPLRLFIHLYALHIHPCPANTHHKLLLLYPPSTQQLTSLFPFLSNSPSILLNMSCFLSSSVVINITLFSPFVIYLSNFIHFRRMGVNCPAIRWHKMCQKISTIEFNPRRTR